MLAFEHTLFMLLLLIGLLSARPKYPWLSTAALVSGVILLLSAPRLTLPLPWKWILAAVIPILFWQNNHYWMQAKRFASWRENMLWLAAMLIITLTLVFIVRLNWLAALLFSIIATSLLWRFIDPRSQPRLLTQLGILVLIFLLTEVSLIVEAPKRYIGSLFSGAAIGLAIALASLHLAEKTSQQPHSWLAVLQVYAAYALATVTKSSGVVAALVSVVAYTEGVPKESKPQLHHLTPLDRWGVYLPFLLLFWLLGWQIHVPFSMRFVIESAAGLLLGMFISWMVSKTDHQVTQSTVQLLISGIQLGTFIFASLILWPKHLMENPWPFLFALALAAIASILSAALVKATKEI